SDQAAVVILEAAFPSPILELGGLVLLVSSFLAPPTFLPSGGVVALHLALPLVPALFARLEGLGQLHPQLLLVLLLLRHALANVGEQLEMVFAPSGSQLHALLFPATKEGSVSGGRRGQAAMELALLALGSLARALHIVVILR